MGEMPVRFFDHVALAVRSLEDAARLFRDVLGATFTRSELVYLLVLAEAERAAVAPGASWAPFYATFFADRYA